MRKIRKGRIKGIRKRKPRKRRRKMIRMTQIALMKKMTLRMYADTS